ncbi:MAG: hypothetical protein RBR02_06205 [Desulfuromonadaceae bacterium]|nr:hypothetical protein [Desulfuromonadaceae bacterium]
MLDFLKYYITFHNVYEYIYFYNEQDILSFLYSNNCSINKRKIFINEQEYDIGLIRKNDKKFKIIKWGKKHVKKILFDSKIQQWDDLIKVLKVHKYDLLVFNEKGYKIISQDIDLAEIIGQADNFMVYRDTNEKKSEILLSLEKNEYTERFVVRKLKGVYTYDVPLKKLLQKSKPFTNNIM